MEELKLPTVSHQRQAVFIPKLQQILSDMVKICVCIYIYPRQDIQGCVGKSAGWGIHSSHLRSKFPGALVSSFHLYLLCAYELSFFLPSPRVILGDG